MQKVKVGDKLKTEYMNHKESGIVEKRFYIKNNGKHILANDISYADMNETFIVFESQGVYPAYETTIQSRKNKENNTKYFYFIDLYGQSRYIELNQFNLEIVEQPINESEFIEWYSFGVEPPRFRIDTNGELYVS